MNCQPLTAEQSEGIDAQMQQHTIQTKTGVQKIIGTGNDQKADQDTDQTGSQPVYPPKFRFQAHTMYKKEPDQYKRVKGEL